MTPLQAAARALCKAQSGVNCYDDLEPEAQEIAVETVRAVILAIREPSPEMARAGDIDIPAQSEATEYWQYPLGENEAGNVWRAMIDAALSEQP